MTPVKVKMTPIKPPCRMNIYATQLQRLYINILKRDYYVLSCVRDGNTVIVTTSTSDNPLVFGNTTIEYRLEPK